VQFGPADYAMSIGRAGEWTHQDVLAAERKTIETALRKGVHPRAEISAPEQAARYLDMGVKHFCMGWDVAILHAWWRDNGKEMRKILGGA
jgi:2-keto-3-deoxy-L-rhamnonate aldolase RhmA